MGDDQENDSQDPQKHSKNAKMFHFEFPLPLLKPLVVPGLLRSDIILCSTRLPQRFLKPCFSFRFRPAVPDTAVFSRWVLWS